MYLTYLYMPEGYVLLCPVDQESHHKALLMYPN